MQCWSMDGETIAALCVVLTLPVPKGGGNEAARFCFAAQALWAWRRVRHLVSPVRNFSLNSQRKDLYRLLDHVDLLSAL